MKCNWSVYDEHWNEVTCSTPAVPGMEACAKHADPEELGELIWALDADLRLARQKNRELNRRWQTTAAEARKDEKRFLARVSELAGIEKRCEEAELQSRFAVSHARGLELELQKLKG